MMQAQSNELKPGIYKHYTGKMYELAGVARSSENPEQLIVVYRQLYESTLQPDGIKLPKGTLWTRTIEMFQAFITDDLGNRVQRFQWIERHSINE